MAFSASLALEVNFCAPACYAEPTTATLYMISSNLISPNKKDTSSEVSLFWWAI